MRFSKEQLLAALAAVSDQWSDPTSADDVNPNYRLITLVAGGIWPPAGQVFRFVLDEFAPVWSAWISRVEPGGNIRSHIDQGPYRERWQVPIQPAGTMNDVPAAAGVPFRVKHWEPHSVENPTDTPRIHIVIDRDVPAGVPSAPFQRLDLE